MSKSGKMFVRDASPLTAIWRDQVAKAAKAQYTGELLTGPVLMFLDFRFARPKSHTKRYQPHWHITTPDLTKIIRSTEDSLTGIVYKDDSQVCTRTESKRYCNPGEEPGVTIYLTEIDNNGTYPQT
ncbi:MAG: RusA family crossover junction endodeoxyribonuclease [Candidatus Obscuribacterales bacterium]|nr:RusA family crossover junction endodeoxyribonuclease [Candidatus Obscuribacterales bacterium]